MELEGAHAWRSLKFVSKANGVYKRDYTFRMNVMEAILRSCIEILANDIEVDTAEECML